MVSKTSNMALSLDFSLFFCYLQCSFMFDCWTIFVILDTNKLVLRMKHVADGEF